LLDYALSQTGNLLPLGNGASYFNGAVDLNTVRGHIYYRRAPVAVRIVWPNQAVGHFVVLSGYSDTGWVVVHDPLYGDSTYDYATFVTRYRNTGKCTHTFFTKR